MSVFATDVSGGETCDTDVLNTDTGPVNLRAEFEPETINLKWYNDNTRVSVTTASNTCTYDTPINLPTDPVKPGYKFKGWNIIPGTRVEYIESTGTQWINTGFKFTGNVVKYELKCNVPANISNTTLFGASDNNNNWSGLLYFYQNTFLLFVGINNNIHSVYVQSPTIGTTVAYSVTIDRVNNTWNFLMNATNSINRSGTFSGIVTNSVNIALFAHNMGNGGITQRASYKNYGFKITQDGTLVRNMIPIKDYNGVACMYDLVTKQIFYNSGSGDFIAGPDL